MNMLMRRRLMMMLGGNAEMLGELSKYQQVKITATATAELSVTHTLGVVPKIVIVDSELTATNKIRGFVGNEFAGVARYTTGTSGGGLFYYIVTSWESPDNARFYWDENEIHIRQASNTRNWNVNTEYTVHIYA